MISLHNELKLHFTNDQLSYYKYVHRLDSCWRAATESGILTLVNKCHKLKVFTASRCKSVTDLAITMLMEKCPLITEIDLSSCYRVRRC